MPNHENTLKALRVPLSRMRERAGVRATYLILLALSIINLQGCFPVVATGAGTGVLMAEDRRTAGAYVEDEGIELKASTRLNDKFKDTVHINVTSYNRNVLMTGEVPTEAAKQDAEQIVRSVTGARNVLNELAIAGISSYTARSNDTYLTSKVKVRFVDQGKFQVNHVKVVTENGVVYLLGLVTRKEADNAVEIARTTGGVQKVVKVFEYLD
ncbi:MAG: BON domain-containing protein [Sulfuricella sp.]|nr:BON domain-containing protein [Sulfuricella sp.]